MGNISSNHLLKRPNEIDWNGEYANAAWRSARSRELDNYGGFTRPAFERGRSITAGLMLLEGAVSVQGANMEKELYKRWWDAKKSRNMGKLVSHGEPDPFNSLQHQGHKDQKQLDSSRKKRVTSETGAHKPKSPGKGGAPRETKEAGKLEQQASKKRPPEDLSPELEQGLDAFKPEPLLPVPCSTIVNCHTGVAVEVADWRLHLHAARRRIILKVLTIIRLRRGLVAPMRMRRVEEFGWMIPGVLGDERLPRFVEDQKQLIQLRSQLKLLKGSFDSLQAELRADYHALVNAVSKKDSENPSQFALAGSEAESHLHNVEGNAEESNADMELETGIEAIEEGQEEEGREDERGGTDRDLKAESSGVNGDVAEAVLAAPTPGKAGKKGHKGGQKGNKKKGWGLGDSAAERSKALQEQSEAAAAAALKRAQAAEHNARWFGGAVVQSKVEAEARAARKAAEQQASAANAAQVEAEELEQSLHMLMQKEYLLAAHPAIQFEESQVSGIAIDVPSALTSTGPPSSSSPIKQQQQQPQVFRLQPQGPTSPSPAPTSQPPPPPPVVPNTSLPPFGAMISAQDPAASTPAPKPASGLSASSTEVTAGPTLTNTSKAPANPPLPPSNSLQPHPLNLPTQHQHPALPDLGPRSSQLEPLQHLPPQPEFHTHASDSITPLIRPGLPCSNSGVILLPPVEIAVHQPQPLNLPAATHHLPPSGSPYAGTFKSSLNNSILPLIPRPSQEVMRPAGASEAQSSLHHQGQHQQQQPTGQTTFPGPNFMLSMLSMMSQNTKLFNRRSYLGGHLGSLDVSSRDAHPLTKGNSLTPVGSSLMASFAPFSSVPGLPSTSNTHQLLAKGRSRMAIARREALGDHAPKGHEPQAVESISFSDSYSGEDGRRRRESESDGVQGKKWASMDGIPPPAQQAGRALRTVQSSCQRQQLRAQMMQHMQEQQQMLLIDGSRSLNGRTPVAVAKSILGSERRPRAVAEGMEGGGIDLAASNSGCRLYAIRVSGAARPVAEGVEGEGHADSRVGGRQEQQEHPQLFDAANEERWLQDEQVNGISSPRPVSPSRQQAASTPSPVSLQHQNSSIREKLQMLKQGLVHRGSGGALGLGSFDPVSGSCGTSSFPTSSIQHTPQADAQLHPSPPRSPPTTQPFTLDTSHGPSSRRPPRYKANGMIQAPSNPEDRLTASDQETLDRIDDIRKRQQQHTSAIALDHSEEAKARRKPFLLWSRIEQLQKMAKQLQQAQDSLSAIEHRLHMHVNRSNSAWADQHTWVPPDIWGLEEMDSWRRSTAARTYRGAAVDCLRSGQVAFHFNAFEDLFETQGAGSQNLWCSDPWDLLLQCRPGMGSLPGKTNKQTPLMWGSRVIAALVQSLKAAAGHKQAQEAVSQAWVIIALDDQIEQTVVKDMWARKFYGLNRERVMFVLQTRRPAFAYDSSRSQFVSDELSASLAPGTGLTFMQLAWSCEAYILGEDGSPTPVQGTVLEALAQHDAQWLLSRRARDMGIISDTGAFSVDGLAYSIFMRDKARAGAMVEVMFEGGDLSLQLSKTMDSIVLSNKAIHVAWRKTIKPALMDTLPLNGMKNVVEMSHAELQGGMGGVNGVQLLRELKAAMGNRVAIGCGRCTYHLPTLKATLTTPALFRPKLCLMAQGERLGVQLDARDVLAAPSVRCMGMLAGKQEWRGALLDSQSMDVLLQLLQEQDSSPDLRKMVPGLRLPPTAQVIGHSTGSYRILAVPQTSLKVAKDVPQQTIVVFVTNNRVSQIAVDVAVAIAMPGRDTLRLVTFLHTDSPDVRSDAEDTLARLYRSMLRTHGGGVGMGAANSAAYVEIVVRGDSSLIDCMENYLAAHDATLAVLGSERLTQGAGVGSVIGSVALSLLRRVPTPTVLVTNNSYKLVSPKSEASRLGEPGTQGNGSSNSSVAGTDSIGPRLRLGVVVEPAATHMHSFMCQLLASQKRKDQVVLLQPMLPDSSTNKLNHLRRVMGQFGAASVSYGVDVHKFMQVEGVMDVVVPVAAEQCGINVLGVALTGHALPLHMLNLMRNYKGAVLVYRLRPSDGQQGKQTS